MKTLFRTWCIFVMGALVINTVAADVTEFTSTGLPEIDFKAGDGNTGVPDITLPSELPLLVGVSIFSLIFKILIFTLYCKQLQKVLS